MYEVTEEELFADRLEEMLRLQALLQERFVGAHPRHLTKDNLKDYVRTMVLACTDELHEALREVPWKPWSAAVFTSEMEDRYKDELVDAFHFFMNLMLVVNMSADELFSRYLRKHEVNHGRIDDGYISPTG